MADALVVDGVTVEVGTVEARLLPARDWEDPPDMGGTLPWCWAGVVPLFFRFPGGAVMTKRVKAIHRMSEDAPTERERAAGFIALIEDLHRLVARHGVTVGDFDFHAEVAS